MEYKCNATAEVKKRNEDAESKNGRMENWVVQFHQLRKMKREMEIINICADADTTVRDDESGRDDADDGARKIK